MNKIIGGVLIASGAIFTLSTASACEPRHAGLFSEKIFADMDTNKDGVVSKKEFDAYHNKHFKALDTNHDGKITIEEFLAAHPPLSKDHCDEPHQAIGHPHGFEEQHSDSFINKHFDAADTNHDGALSREEAKSAPMILEHFDEIDVNKDGKVTEEELKKWLEGYGAEHAKDEKTPEKK
jgi:Ca2+-binding EF-hand superfamily protein